MSNMIIPVILAGGSGKRLWPLSSEQKPKQFLRLDKNSNLSLLQATTKRVLEVAEPENIIVVTSENYAEEVFQQLEFIDKKTTKNILLEPIAKNTAAAIGVAALYAEQKFKDAILWIVPADHVMEDSQPLIQVIKLSSDLIKDQILTFGIKPNRVEKGYGYMLAGEEKYTGMYSVDDFIEKPPEEIAENLIEKENCYWNSGIFYVSAKTVLNQVGSKNIDFLRQIYELDRGKEKTKFGYIYSKENYENIEAISIDKMVMERNKNLLVCPISIGWSDVGSWQSLWESSQKDDQEGLSPLEKFLNKIKKAA